jgi:hypothetical protein
VSANEEDHLAANGTFAVPIEDELGNPRIVVIQFHSK